MTDGPAHRAALLRDAVPPGHAPRGCAGLPARREGRRGSDASGLGVVSETGQAQTVCHADHASRSRQEKQHVRPRYRVGRRAESA